jgi:hypothetical protein
MCSFLTPERYLCSQSATLHVFTADEALGEPIEVFESRLTDSNFNRSQHALSNSFTALVLIMASGLLIVGILVRSPDPSGFRTLVYAVSARDQTTSKKVTLTPQSLSWLEAT